PPEGARRARQPVVRHQGGARGLGGEGSDRPLRQAAPRKRLGRRSRARRDRRPGDPGDRRRRRALRKRAAAGAGHGVRRRAGRSARGRARVVSEALMAEVTYLEAIKQGLAEEMERDERVFLLGEDIGPYGGAFKVTEGFESRFGADRVIETPISEIAIVG